jgi:hypothetical protein
VVTLELYPSLLIIISAIYAVSAVYLANHYRKKRLNITLLLIAFFAVSSILYFGYYLDIITVLPINNVMVIPFFALTAFGILLLIAIVMIGYKELYLLPPFIAAIGLINIYVAESALTTTINLLQYFSYVATGSFVGETWLVVLTQSSPVVVALINSDPFLTSLNNLLNPLFATSTQTYLSILAIYMLVISAPAIVLFFFLARRNRSGRSLGFALGIIAMDMSALLGLNQVTSAIIMVVAAALFVLGITGVFDKLIPKEEKPKKATSLKARSK